MVKNCPYCGEEQSALKNHVRLASGDGHGASGQYPDDFDRPDQDDDDDPGGATASLPTPSAEGGAVAVQEPPEPETEGPQEVPEYGQEDDDEGGVVAFTEDEFENVFDAAYDAGRQDAETEAGLGLSDEGEDDEEDDVVEVEAVSVDSPEDDEDGDEKDDESSSSGGVTLGTVLMWVIVLPLLAAVALAALAAGTGNDQNQNDLGPAFGPGGQQTVDVPGV